MSQEATTTDNLDLNAQFKRAYDFLENSDGNIFITGKAGTGKSTLLEYFRDFTAKNIVVLAPTGVAAVNVKGQTIHSFFRFKPDITPQSVDSIRVRKAQREIYKKIDAIVIDEVSMVRADLLDCIDAFLRIYGHDPKKPFGGVQMIFFGDLYQLPPVVTYSDREIFNGFYKSPYFFDAKVFSNIAMNYIELDKIYRQKEEGFVRLLNAIRENTATAEDLNSLNERCLPEFQPQESDLYVFLTTTNEMANRINEEQLRLLKTRPFRFEGEIMGDFDERVLPTQIALDLKYHAQVMLLNNDPNGRWYNGSIGKVISLLEDAENHTPVVRVELTNGSRVDVTPFTWEMFKFFYNEETEKLESESVGAFMQFPLKLAWAVTIHKSQGMTFSNVVIDVGRGTFSHGQMYVALSRCTSLEGLVLKRPILQRHILMDRRVVDFTSGLRYEFPEECSV